MRHRVGGRKLNVPSDQRKALLRGLVSATLWNEEITTTEARAKEAARMVEKLITMARRNDLAARRQVQRLIFEQNEPFQGADRPRHGDPRAGHRLLRRIFEEVAPLYRDVRGGYTRIIRLGPRRGDAAMMVRLELTKGIPMSQRPATAKTAPKTAAASAAAVPVAPAAESPTSTAPATPAATQEETSTSE